MGKKYLYYTLFIISSIIGLFSYNSISKVYEKRDAVDSLSRRIAELKEENLKLTSDLEYKKTDDFVINEARMKLNYGFKNEQMYIVPKGSPEKKADTADLNEQPNNKDTKDNLLQPSGIEIGQSMGLPVYKLWVKAFF